ncbi:MAG: FAD binding domain-containing protein [Acidimicrobiales bacterium]
MSVASFTIAVTVAQALDAVAAGARPVAGGTDLVVGSRQGKKPLPEALVAIDRLQELAVVEPSADGLRVGALLSHARLMSDEAIVADYTALADGAALVGSPATRNVGTLGGNIMNGSPAMDTGAPLAVLGAEVELQSATDGQRRLPVLDLWTGPGTTAAADSELCTAVILPARAARSGSAYVRLEYRRAMEIAVVGAAASITLALDNTVSAAAIALAAVAPTIIALEGIDGLIGRPVDGELLEEVARIAAEQSTPISDLRASDRYRRHTVGVMARRAVSAAAERARGQLIPVPVNRSLGIGTALAATTTSGGTT